MHKVSAIAPRFDCARQNSTRHMILPSQRAFFQQFDLVAAVFLSAKLQTCYLDQELRRIQKSFKTFHWAWYIQFSQNVLTSLKMSGKLFPVILSQCFTVFTVLKNIHLRAGYNFSPQLKYIFTRFGNPALPELSKNCWQAMFMAAVHNACLTNALRISSIISVYTCQLRISSAFCLLNTVVQARIFCCALRHVEYVLKSRFVFLRNAYFIHEWHRVTSYACIHTRELTNVIKTYSVRYLHWIFRYVIFTKSCLL